MLIKFNSKNPILNNPSFVASNASVIGDVVLYKDSNIWFNAVLRADINKIEVGEGSNIQDGTVVHVDHDKPVVIGKHVTVGHNVTLHGCTIGDNALIGMGSILLDACVIGENSIIGAGAVVTQGTVIPADSLVLGSPAKVKREVTEEEKQKVKKNALLYIDLGKKYSRGE